MNPLISIVVPVYNAADFLAETIHSVLAQTYTNWELILVNDGSTDDSETVAKAFVEKDSRIRYYTKENGGQASARNYGIREAKGEYIGFLDSDDLWLTGKLADQIYELEEHRPDFLYGLGYYYYPERERGQQLEAYPWISGKFDGITFFQHLFHSCAVNTNTVLIKKETLDKIGYFDESEVLRGTEDWDLWLRISKEIPTVFGSPKRNVYYRIHPGGIHLQHTRMLFGKLAIYAKYDESPLIPSLYRKREYRYIYRELINRLHAENRSEEVPAILSDFRKKDPFGIGTWIQSISTRILPYSWSDRFNRKINYRIAYRMEKIGYFLFLNDPRK